MTPSASRARNKFRRKPYVVFSTPRSGSSFIYELLAGYLDQTNHYRLLGEYFNFGVVTFWKEEPHRKRDRPPAYRAIDPPPRLELARLHSLKLNPEGWILKVHLSPWLDFKVYEWLMENCECFFVERRDLFKQTLSHLISQTTGVWYQEPPLEIKPNSLEPHLNYLYDFANQMKLYIKIRELFPAPKIFTYEYFVAEQNLAELLRNFGLDQPFDIGKCAIPNRQNPDDKLSLFKRPEKIIEAYRRTFMQAYRPV